MIRNYWLKYFFEIVRGVGAGEAGAFTKFQRLPTFSKKLLLRWYDVLCRHYKNHYFFLEKWSHHYDFMNVIRVTSFYSLTLSKTSKSKNTFGGPKVFLLFQKKSRFSYRVLKKINSQRVKESCIIWQKIVL